MNNLAAELAIASRSLADNEAVIESGLDAFVEVGTALLAIKANKQYKSAGYSTFKDYCSRRWNIGRTYGHRLIVAAATAEALARDLTPLTGGDDVSPEVLPMGNIPTPTSERQVRPLTAVPEPERAGVWVDAVETAGGAQPTAAQVEAAVQRRVDAENEPNDSAPSRRPAPAPPLTDEELAAAEVSKALDRRARRLEHICSNWHEFRAFCQRDGYERDAVLGRLVQSDVDILTAAEMEITWTS